jgi:redox-sensitive bicupin YhaK (pirin superfamily)
MTIRLHKSEDRGKSNHGWLDTRHSFSFARWYESDHMGIGSLRVLNQIVI